MGKAMSLIRKPFRDFNLEERAHRIISQDKPTLAPKHASDKIDLERALKEYPEIYEESLKKNKQLDKYLKDVFVKSEDPMATTSKSDPNRPLPLDRKPVNDFEYGIKEPAIIPVGRTTLKNALKFITDHQTDAKVNSIEKIALDHQIPAETIKNVLKYYKVFEVYIPENRKVKAHFAGPTVPRIKIVPNQPKKLPSKFKDKHSNDET